MLKRRTFKTILAFACIMTLLVPYFTTVYGALKQTDTDAKLTVMMLHEGGEESSESLPNEYVNAYDTTAYKYTLADTTVFKIVEDGDTTYADALYCLDGEKSFPGILNNTQVGIDFKNVGDLFDGQDPEVEGLGYTTQNYKAILWIVNNMYLRKQTPELKDQFLTKVFKNLINDGTSLDEIKAVLTDDDIEVAQQWAIWNFSNGNVEKYRSFPAVQLFDPASDRTGNYAVVTGNADRQVYAKAVYDYLVSAALHGDDEAALTYPSIENRNLVATIDSGYYKVGPFKVRSGTVDSSDYKLELTDKDGNVIVRSKYEILIEGKDTFESQDVLVNQIFDTNYYIYLPIENNRITGLKLKLSYSEYETKASLWTAQENVYQPIALITREKEDIEDEVSVNIEPKNYDLALRKYIVKVGDKNVNRAPTVDVKPLKDGETTADYKHVKEPIEIKPGDRIIYEISVYNEGDVDAKALRIVDYLPAGLVLTENSDVNEQYGWAKDNDLSGEDYTAVVTNALSNSTIRAFDKENGTTLDSKSVRIECTVADGVSSGKVLTNVAEILEDNIAKDRDSDEGSINYDVIEDDYTGNKDNKTDLSDENYHYKGTQDDDDFEKLVVEGGTFDLALQKFITKVNKVAVNPSREPKVDVSKLKDGSSKNATYTTVKTPVTVEQGDIITYKIRVYNEGEISGYAEEVKDYIPKGLGFLVNYTDNLDNYWSLTDDVKTLKLEAINNAIDNLSLDDFTGETDLKNVTVVYDSPIVSSKLKSSDNDTKNLIDGFDPKRDTALDFKDIQVTCVVVDAQAANNNFKNIAEISKHSDENRDTNVIDRDSTPDTVKPEDYPGADKNQDDHDYEVVNTEEPKKFDLSLEKVISKLNDKSIDRNLSVSLENGKLKFTHKETALPVANGDLVTYQILVFNEGEVAGYAQEIKDNIPEGLEFVKDNAVNKQYGWKMYDKNGKETQDVNQAVTIKTDYLSKEKSENNLIKAFNDPSITTNFDGVGKLDYKFVEVVFKVNTKADNKTDLINIAEISDDADENGNPVDDVDSTPNNNKDGEDDQDKEKVRLQEFDLSLKKFITAVNDKAITDREPKLSKDGSGKIVYATNKEPVQVENNNLITYTIRVYNEGDMAGYAKEVSDNVPEGLEFVADNNTNKEFRWKMYDESGKETNDPSKAKTVKTDYLSKDVNANKVLPAYDARADLSDKNPAHQDLKIVFKVVESKVKDSSRELINIAEITDDTDENGNPVDDVDSTPGNNKDGEDDIDKEKVYVKYFDLSLTKDLVKVIVTEDGKTREVAATNQLMKVEINRRKISTTVVKFVYRITVKNEGQIAGYAKEIKDYIPDGLEFIQEDNQQWQKESDTVVKTRALENTLLQPGATASVDITLKWKNAENNMGQKVNIAEITEDYNDSGTPDIDSTPNNRVMTEDDIDDAPVILSISTGAEPVYIVLTTTVLAILATGIILIKKFVL